MIFYAQVINADGMNEKVQKLLDERIVANRRASADLAACVQELPGWYAWWLRRRGHAPEDASRNLIGFSKTRDYDDAAKRMALIRKAMGFDVADQ